MPALACRLTDVLPMGMQLGKEVMVCTSAAVLLWAGVGCALVCSGSSISHEPLCNCTVLCPECPCVLWGVCVWVHRISAAQQCAGARPLPQRRSSVQAPGPRRTCVLPFLCMGGIQPL